MAAYLVARAHLTDMAKFQHYAENVPEVMKKYGGKPIARDPEKITLEGDEQPGLVAVFEFPDRDAVVAFYNDPAYQVLKASREGAGTLHLVAVSGV
ncbi:MAG TPA: DUF1330 domain-containing protein [Sneathiellales bacterium]|jgi:uncharacterized protein (DUF1330 family)|nr:DUF1330 domain-containing protein [Sneathiellales bacterium]